MSFNKNVIFITGGSAGIGAALGVEFAKLGARVALAARSQERLHEVVSAIQSVGGEAMGVICDVTSRDSLDHAVAEVINEWGEIDVSIANAGFGVSGYLQRLSTDDYRRQFDTNVFGLLDTIYATLPHLLKTQGRIVLISSVMGKVGRPASSAYAMSKFAVTGLAESIQYELEEQGVSVSCLHPGLVESNFRMTDNNSQFQEDKKDPAPDWIVVPTEVAAREMIRAIAKRKRDVTITGHGKILVAAHRLIPKIFNTCMNKFGRGKVSKKDRTIIEANKAKRN
jgi:short-subunit dehydrogenase